MVNARYFDVSTFAETVKLQFTGFKMSTKHHLNCDEFQGMQHNACPAKYLTSDIKLYYCQQTELIGSSIN